VSSTGTVVNIVGADDPPEEFLHLVGVLVDTPGATDPGYGIRAVAADGLFEFGYHQIEGFLPGGFAELTVLPDERLF
jgi:hypothetical protein